MQCQEINSNKYYICRAIWFGVCEIRGIGVGLRLFSLVKFNELVFFFGLPLSNWAAKNMSFKYGVKRLNGVYCWAAAAAAARNPFRAVSTFATAAAAAFGTLDDKKFSMLHDFFDEAAAAAAAAALLVQRPSVFASVATDEVVDELMRCLNTLLLSLRTSPFFIFSIALLT